MNFILLQKDENTKARAGILQTDHGDVETPVFMPVGTQATVKTLSPRELSESKVQMILGNTYHLYLRPGDQLIREFGGLHHFMGWSGPILTDSGGYQVFSLQDLRTIENDGVCFQSHLDGSRHKFTPQRVLEIQQNLGSDIMMVLDECTDFPTTKDKALQSMQLSMEWAKQSRDFYARTKPIYDHDQWLFGIVQGSIFPDLREQSARQLIEMQFPGYAIGGLAVGEPKDVMYSVTNLCTDLLPKEKPRYLMGVGMPEDILESIQVGVDMFDCVIPTRNARNGTVFTWQGRLVIKAARFKHDQKPIDENCGCYTCQTFSRGYLRHLLNSNEILGLRLATLHNIHFYMDLVAEARKHILKNNYLSWKTKVITELTKMIMN